MQKIILTKDATVLVPAGAIIEATEEYGAFLESLGVSRAPTEGEIAASVGITGEALEAARGSLETLSEKDRVKLLAPVFGKQAETVLGLLYPPEIDPGADPEVT